MIVRFRTLAAYAGWALVALAFWALIALVFIV